MTNRYKLYKELLEKDNSINRKRTKQQVVLLQRQQRPVKAQVPKLSPIAAKLKTRFEYTCDKCQEPILYDTLFVDDFTGKYIPLDRETMRTHFKNCKNMKKELIVQ
ncbi:hypothetical protein BH18THE2_BH18THE2_09080 [soil metagenome]